MEILNRLPEEKYVEIDDFLAFLGVHEDVKRLEAFKKNLGIFKGGVVVEAGAGLGELSSAILEVVKPEKLYLVEENPIAYEVLRERFFSLDNVVVVRSLIEEWRPQESIDLLVQEFYGPLLYDESLDALNKLKFKVGKIFPNRGFLKYQVFPLSSLNDPTVNGKIWRKFEGVLISDIFWYFDDYRPCGTVLEWYEGKLRQNKVEIDPSKGDVLLFAVEVWHDDRKLCDPLICPNWPFVFTPVAGKSFSLDFVYQDGFSEVVFRWVE